MSSRLWAPLLTILALFPFPREATPQCPVGDTFLMTGCTSASGTVITATGCCNDADHLRYCHNGVLCETYCETNWCGWTSGRYTCTSSQSSDPSGVNPRKCPCDCTNKQCGDDGCGGSCGSCKSTPE